MFTDHYIQYRKSSLTLFPKVKTLPNDHFAMHIGDLLKYWGPLIKLSEFPGEQHNGALQKIKTNHHLQDLDFTMMRQICRQGRLRALVDKSRYPSLIRDQEGNTHDFDMHVDDTEPDDLNLNDGPGDSDNQSPQNTTANPSSFSASTLFKQALGFLRRDLSTPNRATSAESSSQTLSRKKPDTIPDKTYTSILQYLNDSPRDNKPFRHYAHFPHPLNSVVLPFKGIYRNHIYIHGKLYSPFSIHPGNSSMSFLRARTHPEPAIIQAIWTLEVDGVQRTFLIIQQPVALLPIDQQKNPYHQAPLLQVSLAYDEYEDPIVIEPDVVQGHVPYYKRPPGTFGIDRATVIMVDSLHRGRS
ncbi:hypothetical protein CVT24_010465 [Panaeolus cyanescens]|uniref:Uncharacterized protein n=1 Tax=Panaeolus cyanescens TaxID=181874 RepID=A0A409X432_9AGAR|nr:hypothetical protein CVT24_010465 [Panaeolus cyanescens]